MNLDPCRFFKPPIRRVHTIATDFLSSGAEVLKHRTVKNYQTSNLFCDIEVPPMAGIKKSPNASLNTQDRIFGSAEVVTPRRGRVSDTYRSTVFATAEDIKSTTNQTEANNNSEPELNGKEEVKRNGEVDGNESDLADSGIEKDAQDDVPQKTVEKKKGTEKGTAANSGSPFNTATPVRRVRQPPGGFSSGIW